MGAHGLAALIGADPAVQLGVATQARQAQKEHVAARQCAARTVVIVHHDLATVPTLCDWTCLLNRTVMGCGPTKEVFTDEMVKQAYGLATT